jgi:chromosome segregation ATPase
VSSRESVRRLEQELATARRTIGEREADVRAHTAALAERDQRLTELRAELDELEQQNAAYQEQVLKAYQKIKADETMVARAKKAMAIALTVLDDDSKQPGS